MVSDPTVVFLDANVLARPITRTLLMVGAYDAGFVMTWSAHVEAEAERHLPPRAMSVSVMRQRQEFELGPTGVGAERFVASSAKDRQVLADADAARASFLITDDVDDFDEIDLAALQLTAVHPDLFMALRFPRRAYLRALELMVSRMQDPPRSKAQLHSLLGRQHPRLVAAHADAFDVDVARQTHTAPRELARGVRCVGCESVVDAAQDLSLGLCIDCRP